MTHSTIIDRQGDARIAALLERLPRSEPEHSWEGVLQGATGSTTGHTIEFRATLAFHGGLIEGTGRVAALARSRPDWDDSLVLSGASRDGEVSFSIWLAASAFKQSAFSTTGHLSVDGGEMTGDWSVGCFDPVGCGCQGGGGTFRMKRID